MLRFCYYATDVGTKAVIYIWFGWHRVLRPMPIVARLCLCSTRSWVSPWQMSTMETMVVYTKSYAQWELFLFFLHFYYPVELRRSVNLLSRYQFVSTDWLTDCCCCCCPREEVQKCAPRVYIAPFYIVYRLCWIHSTELIVELICVTSIRRLGLICCCRIAKTVWHVARGAGKCRMRNAENF